MKTKKEFKYFSIFNHEKEQDYFRQMHKHGWKFIKVTGFGTYHFEECDPQDVVYQLDYNQEGLSHKTEYVQMFNDCGWEYIQDYAGYSYFRKPATEMNGEEEIFCDDASRLAMMERVFKGRMIPLLLFALCMFPMFILNLVSYHNYGLTIFIGLIIGIYVGCIVTFRIKYIKYKNRTKK
jgi:hypothetical protein